MRKNWLLFLVTVPATCFGAYWLGSGHTKPGAANPENKPPDHSINGLAVNQSDLEIGEVWEQKDFETVLPIYNQTGAAIDVTDFAVSCGCLAVEPRSLTIPAKETALVRLRINLAKQNRRQIGEMKRPLEVDVTPLFKSGWPKNPGWKLTGVIKNRVTLDKLAVDFGETLVQGQSPLQRTVLAIVHVPIARLEVIADPPLATVQFKPLAVECPPFVGPGKMTVHRTTDLI